MSNIYIRSGLAIGFLFALSCSEQSDPGESEIVVEDSVNIHYVDSIYNLSDTFTMIKKSLCDNGDSLLQYTNENASYIPFDFLDPTANFVYLSNVDCGDPGGTCGDYITLIRRLKAERYFEDLQVCGRLDSIDFTLGRLYYSTVSDNKQYAFNIMESSPQIEYLSINHIPVYEIEYISNQLEVLSDNLYFNDSSPQNPDAIIVLNNVVKLDATLDLVVYSLKFEDVPYGFAFLRDHRHTVRNEVVGGAGEVTWHQTANDVLINYHNVQDMVTNKIDLKKKSFIKI